MIKRYPTYFLFALLALVLSVPDLFAQLRVPVPQDGSYPNSYEEAITQKLLPFISQNDFIVHVTIKKDTIWSADEEQNIDDQDRNYRNLPGILDLSGLNIPMKDSLEMTVSKRPSFRYGNYKMVDIMLSDVYGSKEIQFVANIVKWAIPFNEMEGDSMIISTVRFPEWFAGKDPELFNRKDALNSTVQRYPGGPTYNNTMNTNPQKSNIDSSGYYRQDFAAKDDLWNRLFQVILILLLLVILALLVYLIYKSKGKKKGNQPKYNNGEIIPLDPLPDHSEDEKRQMITWFIKSPKVLSGIIEGEVSQTGQDALVKYEKAIAATNPDLYHLLEPYMNSGTYQNLINGILQQAAKNEHANEEINQIVSRLKALGEFDSQGIFSFLNRINDKQLLFLLRDEQPETIAVTIAQMTTERAKKVLADFDETKKSEILINMVQLNTQPSYMFREVALRLNNKLPEFEGMKDIAIDGLSGVLDILDSVNDETQVRMLAKIEERSPLMAAEISKMFVGFKNIIGLDDAIIEKAVRDIETAEIIQAISGYHREVQAKVINCRPPREQLVIQSQLDVNNTPLESGISVRRKIILSIRNQLRTV
jgi:flagellar motor switch protein FliG